MKSLFYITSCVVTLSLFSCNNEEEGNVQATLIETSSVTDIRDTTAICWGKIINEGSDGVKEYGIAVDNIEWKALSTIAKADSFSVQLRGLNYGHEYIYRAYAITNRGTKIYGKEKTFTTLAPPMGFYISIKESSITAHSVVIAFSDAEKFQDWGVHYNPSGGAVNSGNPKISANGKDSIILTDLLPVTEYSILPYVVDKNNLQGYGYRTDFMTKPGMPTVQLNEASNVTALGATMSFEISTLGRSIKDCGLRYSTDQQDWTDTFISYPNQAIVTFNLTDLFSSTHYYVQAYVEDWGGLVVYSETKEITTLDGLSAMVTPTVTALTSYKVQMEGNIINEINQSIIEYGFCWSTTSGSAVADGNNRIAINTGNIDSFNTIVYRCATGTTYYIRSYAKNTKEIIYSEEVILNVPSVQYGSMADPRDEKTYKTVMIGTQEWMAENLDYAISSPYSKTDGYTTRVYRSINACPTGWHVPSQEEFNIMIQEIGSGSNAFLLTSVGNGINSTGFGATRMEADSQYSYYWTSTVSEVSDIATMLYVFNIYTNNGIILHERFTEFDYAQIRCVKD
jgi:uncharacterized protein (TIGR02145 family)